MTAASSKQRQALKRIFTAGVVVLLLVFGGAIGMLAYSVRSMDLLQIQTEQRLVSRNLAGSLEAMAEAMSSATVWSATAEIMTQPRIHPGDIQANFGDWYADYMNHAVTLSYDVEGRLIHASRDSAAVDIAGEAAFAEAVAPLVSQVRARSLAQRDHPRRFGFDSVEQAQGIVQANGQTYLVGVSTVVAEEGSVAWPAVDPVVVSGKNLSHFLGRLERDLGITDPRVAFGGEASPGAVPLVDPSGREIGRVEWTPHQPGIGILNASAPVIAATLLLLVTASIILLYRVNNLVRRLEEHEIMYTEARDRAEAANEAKSQFLANMSHELRTPLNGVVALGELLRTRQTSPENREMAGLIVSSGQLLERVVNDVLDVSKIEAGKLTLEAIPFDLETTVRRTADLHAASASAKGLELVCHVDDAARGVWRGDPGRLSQIVSNLLSNAVKFTAEGSVTLNVRRLGGRLCLVVRDTGAGFDKEVAARLFQRFEQADSSMTRRHGGTGLGLSICNSLAQLMGGRLRARGVPGKGAIFAATLPLQWLSEAAAPEAEAPAVKGGAARAPQRGPRILLAEDHVTNQRVVSLILAAIGAQLTVVDNGELAVAEATTRAFDLILMDMQMPVMDGLAATRLIRDHEAATNSGRTPVIALTAHALPEHVAASLAAGADRHLTKPIRPDDLLGAVDAVLRATAANTDSAAA